MAEHTPAPWVQFVDQGKCIALMPAMRSGDICTFTQSPSDADARLMAAAPMLAKTLDQISRESDDPYARRLAIGVLALVAGSKQP